MHICATWCWTSVSGTGDGGTRGSVSRKANSSERLLRTVAVTRDTVWQQVVVAVHDTLREVTTIALQHNDRGDTLKLMQVTDRTRASSSSDLREKKERTEVRVDTVYEEKQSDNTVAVAGPGVTVDKDGTLIVNRSPLTFMKWLFAILCATIVLVVTIKLCLRKAL